MIVRVEDIFFVFAVAGDVHLADAMVGDLVQVIVGVESVVFAGDVDVVDVQQNSAVGQFDHFGQELPFGHFRDVEFGIAADIFHDDGDFQKILHFPDPAGGVFGGGESVGHREKIMGVGSIDASPAKMIGEEFGVGAFDQSF